jgi:hypothetical protein
MQHQSDLQRWLIKIEDEDNGRGMAFVSTAAIPGLADELADAVESLSNLCQDLGVPPAKGKWPKVNKLIVQEATAVEDLRAELEFKVLQILLKHLNKELKIVMPKAFPSYRAFVQVCVMLEPQWNCCAAHIGMETYRILPVVCEIWGRAVPCFVELCQPGSLMKRVNNCR